MIDISTLLYIENQNQLTEFLPHLERATTVALDTEADSLHHYFEKVCLMQLSVPGADAIIDPLADIDLTPLLNVLSRKTLVIQGADYDLRMMKRDHDFSAANIFDTMLAAQILGYERFSYAALVEKHHGVVLSKHGQKADWSQRPLPEKLITYAAADTHYLLEVANNLREELEAAGRLHWLEECCTRLLDYVSEGMRTPDPEKQWRIKGWHSLKPGRGWAFLRELWRWRDAEAQRMDFPPFKVMRNELLVDLARWAQNGFSAEEMPKLPRNIYGRRRRELDLALARAKDMSPAEWPKSLETPRRSMPPVNDHYVSGVKEVRDKYAAELKIDPGFLLPTSSIIAIAARRPVTVELLRDSTPLYNWQIELMGSDILEALEKAPDEPSAKTVASPRSTSQKKLQVNQ